MPFPDKESELKDYQIVFATAKGKVRKASFLGRNITITTQKGSSVKLNCGSLIKALKFQGHEKNIKLPDINKGFLGIGGGEKDVLQKLFTKLFDYYSSTQQLPAERASAKEKIAAVSARVDEIKTGI